MPSNRRGAVSVFFRSVRSADAYDTRESWAIGAAAAWKVKGFALLENPRRW